MGNKKIIQFISQYAYTISCYEMWQILLSYYK